MNESNNPFEISVMSIDGAIGKDYSMTYRNNGSMYDILWGPVQTQEFSMRIAFPYLRRIKSWMALPLNERINFMNMRRKNKAYNKIITQQAHQTGCSIKGRKVFKIISDLSPLDQI